MAARRLKVSVVENLGATSIVHGQLSDGQTVLIEQRGKVRATAGDTIIVHVDPESVLLFDAKGLRIR